jgi:glycosyltransferase involved in cell wall biosynthesis
MDSMSGQLAAVSQSSEAELSADEESPRRTNAGASLPSTVSEPRAIEAANAQDPPSPSLFDPAFYQAALRARGLSLDGLDPFQHYVQRGDAARIPPHPLFDPAYYALHNPDVASAGVNTLAHYLENGFRERRNPHPLVDLKLIVEQLGADFEGDPLAAYLASSGGALKPHRLVDPGFIATQQKSLDADDARPALLFYLASDPAAINPSPDFDGQSYWRLYPDARDTHPLVHYATIGEAEDRWAPKHRAGIARVAHEIEAAGRLEPDLVKPFADLQATTIMAGYDFARREFRLYRLLTRAAGLHTYAHVIMTPWLKRGGADRAVLLLARALLESDPALRVLIVCTQDDAVEALDWAPVTRRLVVAKIAREVDDANDTYVAFANFLRLCGCRHLHIVNSLFGWDLVEKYGRMLKPLMRIYGFAFCQDYDDKGRRAGYAWTRLGRAIEQLSAVVSDNSRVIQEFADDHRFDADDIRKFFCLYLPADDRLEGIAAEQVAQNLQQGAARRHRIFWAGRFTVQKGLDTAADIARALGEVEICAFGGVAEAGPVDPPKNFVVRGPFEDFADLPLHEASLFLHTGRWEGLPNVLLEAGAAGLPIVAPDVGGIGDLVDELTGWLVARDSGVDGYVAAIRDALARPEEARARAKRMRERIRARHAPEVFSESVQRLMRLGAGDGA